MKMLRLKRKSKMLLEREETIYTSSVQDLMKNAGVKPIDNLWKPRISPVAGGCLLTCVSMMLATIYQFGNNSEIVFECVSVLSFFFMCILKMKCLWSNRLSWTSMIHNAALLEKQQLENHNTNTYEYETDDEENELTVSSFHIKKYTQRRVNISQLIRRFYRFTVVFYIIMPLLEYFIRKTFMSEAVVKLPYVLPGWWFLDDMSVSGYVAAFLTQTIAALYGNLIHIYFDVTVVSFMIFISGQYKLLRAYSERIGGKGTHLLLSKQRDQRAHERIKKCHQLHIRLKKFSSEIGDLLCYVLGIYFFVAAITLCSIAYRMKTEQVGMLQLFQMFQYMSGNLIQLFLYCYHGEDLFNQSMVGTGEGPFAGSHWCLSPAVRKELMLLGVGMMQPSRIFAGPFNYLDLTSFIQIIRAAYSYYAVLRE